MSNRVGSNLLVKVVKKFPFGVRVQFENDNTGLIHVSQLRGNSREIREERLKALEVGAQMYAEILENRPGKLEDERGLHRNWSLSEKMAYERTITERMRLFEFFSGTVHSKADYGVFVYLKIWHVLGLLHVSRMEGERASRDRYFESLQEGHPISAMVTKIEQKPRRLEFQLSQRYE